MNVRLAIQRHPTRAVIAAVLAVALFIFGMLWFTPWRLFTDERVSEPVPTTDAAAPPPASGMAPAVMSGGRDEAEAIQTLVTGEFVSLEHESHGVVRVLEYADGARFLRFERFATSNGPDLFVYLSTKDADPRDWHGYDADFVDLGPLEGNVGSQNYRIPVGVDLEEYSTAVVWCRRFQVGFAAADLD